MRFHVKKGDEVEVISGNFKGSTGKILEVLPNKQRVLVEGVRIIKKHLRKSEDNPQGKIAEREGPIHISNVKKIGWCPLCANGISTKMSTRFRGSRKSWSTLRLARKRT